MAGGDAMLYILGIQPQRTTSTVHHLSNQHGCSYRDGTTVQPRFPPKLQRGHIASPAGRHLPLPLLHCLRHLPNHPPASRHKRSRSHYSRQGRPNPHPPSLHHRSKTSSIGRICPLEPWPPRFPPIGGRIWAAGLISRSGVGGLSI